MILSAEGWDKKLNDSVPATGRIALTALGKLMRKNYPYNAVREAARLKALGGLAAAVRLYPEVYKIDDDTFVRRVLYDDGSDDPLHFFG